MDSATFHTGPLGNTRSAEAAVTFGVLMRFRTRHQEKLATRYRDVWADFSRNSHRPVQESWIPVQHRRLPREKFCEGRVPSTEAWRSLQRGLDWECLYITLLSSGAAALGAELNKRLYT